ncbi:DUF6301 family protein [Actinomyces respiraculi]|uniref:DUF6301 family protein n=1 Tax=Actinomyces respiraculi TaxID=2744574 RepID=UPI0014244F6E|nr:DUF6301 family protein [Actinomyces respiraculi]
MKMETLPVETAVEWITAWTNLTWPVSWDTAFAIRDRLGWIAESQDGRYFRTVLTPPGKEGEGVIGARDDHEFDGVVFLLATLVTRDLKDETTAPTTWAAYESYVTALTKTFGEPRTTVNRRGASNEYRQCKWYLPNNSSFSLGAQSGVIEVSINSPEDTWVDLEYQRMEEKYGPDWEEQFE